MTEAATSRCRNGATSSVVECRKIIWYRAKFMRERVLITGIGCVSCFGIGHSALFNAIKSGSCGVVPITAFDTSECHSHRAATIRDFDPAAFIPPMKLRRIDAVSRVALVCARLLFDDAGRMPGPDGDDDIGVALGT